VTPRTGTEVLDDHVERRRAVAASQVPVVDQQLPEVLRLVRRIVHLVGDHDEADRRLLVVDAHAIACAPGSSAASTSESFTDDTNRSCLPVTREEPRVPHGSHP
jgi:hypothetical protein